MVEGWISIHRKIVDSDIYQMPPLYLRVFERLLIEANHQDGEIPYRKKGEKVTGKKLIKRGERLTSVRDICRWVSWYERGKEVIPNPKTIQNILDWLVENNMIEIYGVKGNRTETHYKVVNYNNYQDDNGNKVTEKKQSADTNNNVNNIYISIRGLPDGKLKERLTDFVAMREEMEKPLDEKGIEILLKKLESIGKNEDERIQILEQSVLNRWQDIYPLKEKTVDKSVDKLWKGVDKPKKQNTFHNFDSKIGNYSEQELEEIARKKLRKKGEND